ncbi:MAG: histidine phosphatase family protein [Lachnospiraceae bacterium]|uniref:histidine phosphatase family protein n=1 Tax=Parablautia sp. Marseille-Q6255 TaxID=3039593 RepID=UPI0024BC106C|nr:histidine phosphatase family protein [Parablautia sp. Marseille-Q6255]
MRLYIIRHGETAWNTQLRLQGQTDIELNENGRLLAKKTAQAMRGIPFDLVLTSPLSRAKETALLVLDGRNIPVIEDTRIREISFGDMEGERISKEEREDPNSRFYRFFHDPGHYIAAAHGESIQSLCERTADFLAELKEKKEWQDKTILISTHGAASRALLCAVKNTPLCDFWQGGVPKNCAVTIIDLEEGMWKIKEQDVIYYENV